MGLEEVLESVEDDVPRFIVELIEIYGPMFWVILQFGEQLIYLTGLILRLELIPSIVICCFYSFLACLYSSDSSFLGRGCGITVI